MYHLGAVGVVDATTPGSICARDRFPLPPPGPTNNANATRRNPNKTSYCSVYRTNPFAPGRAVAAVLLLLVVVVVVVVAIGHGSTPIGIVDTIVVGRYTSPPARHHPDNWVGHGRVKMSIGNDAIVAAYPTSKMKIQVVGGNDDESVFVVRGSWRCWLVTRRCHSSMSILHDHHSLVFQQPP